VCDTGTTYCAYLMIRKLFWIILVKFVRFKKGSAKDCDTYLGAQNGKHYLPDDPNKIRWSIACRQRSWAGELEACRPRDNANGDQHPEMDVTPELNAE
jgi:hypothetical protein